MIMGFIDTMREQGRSVESTCRVLTSLGVKVAARTYRVHQATREVGPRLLALASLMNVIHTLAFVWDHRTSRYRLRPEGLYGRRKMTALLARHGHQASYGRVDTAMRMLGHQGITRRKKVVTTIPGKDGHRAGDLLNRDFTAAAPNLIWVTDFTYVRTWAGFVYVAFIVDVYAQRILAWHAQTTKHTDLVMLPLRMALWERHREAHPPTPHELIHHSDAGSQGVFNRSSQHLDQEVGCGASSGGCGSGGAAEAEVAGAPGSSAGGRAGVLGEDRRGSVQ
jgi:hypothetical protein